jgi:hypothetical protein
MRQGRRWAGIALATMVGLAACGDVDETGAADEGAVAGEAEVAGEVESVLPEPACEPSERMDVVGRSSPYDSATIRIGDGMAKVCYGRPSLRGRTMIGGDAVPYDTLWRTGANEPTIIHLNVAAEIAGMAVEPGSYALYTIPREGEEWTLIVNRSTSQWGHESSYNQEVRAQEVGRAPVQAETLDSRVDQLTIRPVDRRAPGETAAGETGGAGEESGLLLEWQNSRVHIPVTPAD